MIMNLATAPTNIGPGKILLLTQLLAQGLKISPDRVLLEIVTENSRKKRQGDLETELQVTITPSNDTTGEPSANEAVQNFINNQTAINNVQEQVPEVVDFNGKPLSSKSLIQIRSDLLTSFVR